MPETETKILVTFEDQFGLETLTSLLIYILYQCKFHKKKHSQHMKL